tara:strand:+ start:605 stop:1546 length:942 start_codon:yes stop_codon:yes gene_type:complete
MTVVTLPTHATDLVAPFLSAQTSDATRTAYASDLSEFFGTTLVTADQAQSVTIEDVETYRNLLVTAGRRPSTINRKLTSLRAFYRRLIALRIVDVSPADPAVVKGFRVDSAAIGKAIDSDVLAQMLSDAQSQRNALKGHRDYALLLTLLYGGLRRAEAASIRWTDLIVEAGHTVAQLPATKSGVMQHVKLAPVVVQAIEAWREAAADAGIESDYVFVSINHNNYGGQLRYASVREICQFYGQRAGVELTAHSFRHTCATLALEGGAKPQQVQGHLRHADLKTTMRYFEDRNALNDNATDYINVGPINPTKQEQ